MKYHASITKDVALLLLTWKDVHSVWLSEEDCKGYMQKYYIDHLSPAGPLVILLIVFMFCEFSEFLYYYNQLFYIRKIVYIYKTKLSDLSQVAVFCLVFPQGRNA